MISSFSLITLVLFLFPLPRYAENFLLPSYHFGGVQWHQYLNIVSLIYAG